MKNYSLIEHRDYKMESLGDKPASRVLREGVEAIEKTGIRYWLSSGTLLGIYRDGGLMREDTDVDIGIIGADPGIVEEIMEKAGFELIRSLNYQGFAQQRAFIKDDVIFDIYFNYLQNGFYVNFNEHGWIRKPAEILSWLCMIDFEGKKYECPDSERYLTWRYDDWEIPKRNPGDWSGMRRNHENDIDLRNI